ncbi:hypothetical protein [uncultured Bosea sp.]|uniref:hypothetical protein n=1 Tax=uncultured Bosea sp. TaxID=211457 RepID=UPI0025F28D62|nr:hypothetical protein [uncultured Bosea sp.]
MRMFDRVVAWLAGDREPPAAALVERNFMRTCTCISLVLQEALADADEARWANSRVWLASATHTYFDYGLWNRRSNGNDLAFQRALEGQLRRWGDDLAKQEAINRDQAIEAVRQSSLVLERALEAVRSDDPKNGADFSFTLLHHLLKIVIGEHASSSKAFNPDVALRLDGLMSEAISALRPFENAASR